MKNHTSRSFASLCVLAATIAGAPGAAEAQVVLGHHYRPHYWDLPTQFDQPFVFPGQTLLYNSTSKAFDDKGKRVDTGVDTDTLFGFTIVPYFFKFSADSDWAHAFSINTYEFRSSSANGSISGVGSLIPAFTGWTKPTSASTLGYDILLGTPFSFSSELDSKLWDLYLRGFYDVNIRNWNAEAVVGYHTAFETRSAVSKPRDEYHLNLRLGYDFKGVGAIGLRVTPYLSGDYQRNDKDTANVTNVGGGVFVTHRSGMQWSVGYSKSVDGRNLPETNAVLAQFWMPI